MELQIIITIIKACLQHGFSWFHVAICPYWPSLLVISLDITNVSTELMNISFYWIANTGMFVYWNPLENVSFEFVFISPTVPNMSCSSWIVCEMEGKWLYSYCFFKVQVVPLYNSTNMATSWKNLYDPNL